VFSFDPVGSYEREIYRAAGSASSLLQPLLDNQVRFFTGTDFLGGGGGAPPRNDLHTPQRHLAPPPQIIYILI
jgi:hypothetical protein